MASSANLIAILLFLAALVATINHRFIHLPRAIALLLGSLGISAAIAAINPFVTPDLSGWVRGMLGEAALPQVLLDIVLGLLLFAASLHVDLTELRRQKWTVLVLATASVIIATVVFESVDVGMHFLRRRIARAARLVYGAGRSAGADGRRRGGCTAAPCAFADRVEDCHFRGKPV